LRSTQGIGKDSASRGGHLCQFWITAEARDIDRGIVVLFDLPLAFLAGEVLFPGTRVNSPWLKSAIDAVQVWVQSV
jgi:hypothetical protein